MDYFRQWNRLLLLTFLTTLPAGAHAAGGIDVQNMFTSIITAFWPLWITAAVLVLVMAGFVLMTTHDEGRLEKAKTTLVAVFVGGILTTIIRFLPGDFIGPLNFIGIIYNGTYGISLTSATPSTIGLEAIGISQWLSAVAVMLGILFIIIAVLRAVASLGDEAAYTAARSALLHIIVGIVLIAGAFLVQLAFFGSESGPEEVVKGPLGIQPNPLIGLISEQLLLILNFITLIAVAILIYAGLRMVISFGREEDYTAAKGLVLRVVLGLFVIILSYALVFIVASAFT